MGSWKDFRKGKDMQRAVLPVYGVRGRDRADERRNVVIGAALDEEREKLPVVENGRPVKRRAPESVLLVDVEPVLQQLHHNLYALHRERKTTRCIHLAGIVQGEQPIRRPVVFAVFSLAVRLYLFDVLFLDGVKEGLRSSPSSR